MSFTLHILPGALYTRRVLIYLYEKSILHSPLLTVSPPLIKSSPTASTTHPRPVQPTISKPPGTLPALTTPDGTVIHESLAIISYFEDLCDGAQSCPPYFPSANRDAHLQNESGKGVFVEARLSMRGRSAEERARSHEIVALVEEATTLFELAARHGSAMFLLLQRQDIATSKMAIETCRAALGKVEGFYVDDLRFDVPGEGGKMSMTIADCMLFSLLEFARAMYGVDLTKGLKGLTKFNEIFRRRDSVGVEGAEGKVWDENLTMLAGHWVKETDGVGAWLLERVKIGRLYLRVLGGMVLRA